MRPAADVPALAIMAMLVLLPVIALLANPEILGNRIGDIDTWFYYGHFTSLGDYRNVEPQLVGNNYYQTRLPYLIPGYLIFSLFSEPVAKFVLAYLSYAAAVGCFYYIVLANFGRQHAGLVTVLFATDVFFVRGYGWNYVDIGVLVYYTAGVAAITWSARSAEHRFAKMAVAGFAFVSMLFVHLGSAVLAAPALAYAWYVLRGEPLQPAAVRLCSGIVLGGIVAQLLYGLLNVAIWGSKFFFLLEQIAVGRIELQTNPSWESPVALLANGPWLTIHLAVFVAAILACGLSLARVIRLPGRDLVILFGLVLFYGLLFGLDAGRLSNFTMREGLRMTFLLTVTYFSLAILITPIVSRRLELGVALLAMLALVANLRLHMQPNLVPGWALAALIAAALGVALVVKRPIAMAAAVALLIAARALVAWPFAQAPGIYQAHSLIRSLSGKDLPRFIADAKDPLYGAILAQVVSSFTERAWWMHSTAFPILPAPSVWNKTKLFVLSSQFTDAADVARQLVAEADIVEPIGSFRIGESGSRFMVFGFEVTNRVTLLQPLAKLQNRRSAIPAAELPSVFGPETIVGTGRSTANLKLDAGYLSFGPYAALAAGHYRVVMTYGPSSGAQRWDIVGLGPAGQPIELRSGELPDTVHSGEQLVVELDLAAPVRGVEARTFFVGGGALTLGSVGIVPRP